MTAKMDHAMCNVIYVDRRARGDRLVQREEPSPSNGAGSIGSSYIEITGEHREVAANIQALLSNYNQVYVCTSGSACRLKTTEFNDAINTDLVPTLVLVDIPSDEQIAEENRPPSPNEIRYDYGEVEEQSLYGMRLLQWLASETQYRNLSRLFIPIAVVSSARAHLSSSTSESGYSVSGVLSLHSQESSRNDSTTPSTLDTGQMLGYLDSGAADVVPSPFMKERIAGLAVHAYRAHKEVAKEQKAFLAVKRGRKRSWVGVDDERPYAYLREAMVSGLMDGICKPQTAAETFEFTRILITPERRVRVAQAIAAWDFSAHDFTEDELLHAASLMLQHALTIPALEQWRITTDNLTAFLIATRTAYNSFVPYHNFRHVVDVLQAVFYFLLQLGTLPPYPGRSRPTSPVSKCPIASLLRPFDALTLLITAIGHDVGHPGVNNAFLVTLNAPLAQLYNDRSVLESFHCAAFSQILRRYWPASFQAPDMRTLLINSILATDMGLHFDYMKKMGMLQERLTSDAETSGWDDRYREEQRTLVCSLLIKCADISNVARPHAIAAQWATILTDEFARQASMEDDLGIPSALFAPPVRDSIVEMGKSQIGFMGVFALPLFQGVSRIMPAMRFSVEEMQTNKTIWETKIEEGREAESLGRRDPAGVAPLDGYRLPSGNGSIPGVPLASELHPPEVKAYSGQQSPLTARTPTRETPQDSRRSSLGTIGHQSNGNAVTANRVALGESSPSRRSSSGATLPNGPSLAAAADRPNRQSSGAFSSAYQPALPNRRSSTAVPSQLQLGIAGGAATDAHTNGTSAVSGGNAGAAGGGGRRRSADHSLVAVLVTSSGQTRSSKTTGTGGGGGDPPPTGHTAANNHHHHHHPHSHVRRKSSGKSSLPSSQEWPSQVTSPANDEGAAFTPTTPGTSFRSAESSTERVERTETGRSASFSSLTVTDDGEDGTHHDRRHGHSSHGHPPPPPPPPPPPHQQQQQQQPDSYASSSPSSSMRALRHRSSRWKLNFWKSKRKVSNE